MMYQQKLNEWFNGIPGDVGKEHWDRLIKILDEDEVSQADIDSFMEEVQVRDDDLNELSYSAYEEALQFGLSRDLFLRYFKTIRDRCCQ